MPSYWKIIYNSFIKIKGWVVSIIGFAITILAIYLDFKTEIGIKAILPIAMIVFLIIVVLWDTSLYCFKNMAKKLPKIIMSREPPNLYKNAKTLLLLESSELFGHEAIVSIYFKDQGFEEFIGTGFVLTIQENGYIQIVVTDIQEERHNEFWEKIMGNNKSAIENIIVRPTISKSILTQGE